MAESVTVGSLVYEIIGDNEQFETAANAARKDLRDAAKAFNQTRTPAERYGREIERLNHLRKTGQIDSQVYRRSLAQEKRAYDDARTSAARYIREQRKLQAEQKRSASLFGQTEAALAGFGARFVGPIAAFEAARRGMNLFGKELQELDAIAKQARLLGLTTDQLITLRPAATQASGMIDSQLDMALQRMTRNISLAAVGMGEAQKVLEELGLNAEELNRIGPWQAFLQIADAMEGVSNAQDKLRIGQKLFDSEGAKLVNTLKAGRDGIEEFREQAEEAGLLVGNETTPNIERLNDELDTLGKTLKGAFIRAPIRGLSNVAADAFTEINAVIRDARETTKNITSFFIGDTARAEELTEAIKKASAAARRESEQILREQQRQVRSMSPDLAAQEVIRQSIISGAEMAAGLLGDALQPLSEFGQENLPAFSALQTTLNNWKRDLDIAGKDSLELAKKEQERLKEEQQIREQFTRQNETAEESFMRQIREAESLRQQGIIDQQTFAREQARLQQAYANELEQQISDREQVDVPGARRGSREEYDILRQIRQDAETDEELAQQQREIQIKVQQATTTAVKDVNAAINGLTAAVNRLQPVVGIP